MSTLKLGLRTRGPDLLRFAVLIIVLIAAHGLLRAASGLGLAVLAVLAPVTLFIYVDRYRGAPQPEQLAAFFGAVAVAAALLFLPAATIIAVAALLALGIARLAADRALTGLKYRRVFSPTQLFPGDMAEMTVTVENRKLLPLGWFRVVDPIHVRGGSHKQRLKRLLAISATVEIVEQMMSGVITRGALGSHASSTRSFTVEALHRGVYAFGPARLVSGDPFGLFQREMTAEGGAELIVYPRIVPVEEIAPSFWMAMGAMAARHRRYDDPILLAGSREYRPDDPLRHIHWKATARTGTLQVRLHDPATTTQLMIVLNLNTYGHVWEGVDADRMEAVIEVAASIAVHALERGFEVGLSSNGVVSDVDRTLRVAPGASPRQPNAILEHLARLSYSGGNPPERLLSDEIERQGKQTSIVFITSVLTPTLIELLRGTTFRDRGSVVYTGRFAAPVIPDIPIHLVAPGGPDDRAAS